MQSNELRERLHYDYMEHSLFIPNEIFSLLINNIKPIHIPFSYSYYYLISYLYRYTKYSKHLYNNEDIKEILGYNKGTKGLDYLIKKNGVLDQIGLTSTVKDFPIAWVLDDELEFYMYSEDKELLCDIAPYSTMSRKYNVKCPEKAFHRFIYDDGTFDEGTFYSIENTHEIPIKTFIHCMSIEEIGCNGFYLYSYLKHMNQMFNGYDVSIDKLIKDTGLSKSTIKRTLHSLKAYKIIKCKINQDYIHGLPEEERKANTYYINDYDSFSFIPQSYDKAKRININKYREDENNLNKIKDDIDDQLDYLFM